MVSTVSTASGLKEIPRWFLTNGASPYTILALILTEDTKP